MRQADCAAALPLATPYALWQAGTISYIRQLGLNRSAGRSEPVDVLQGCSSGSHLHGSPTIVVLFFLMRLRNLRRHSASPVYIFFSPTHMAIWAASGSEVPKTQNYGIANIIKWNHEGSLSFDIVALTARRITFRLGS